MNDQDFKLLGKAGKFSDNPDKSLLDTWTNDFTDRDYLIQFDCHDFTSLCPVTGQPDFATIYIRYIPNDLCIETKSLKYYLHAFRNTQAFNEKVINRIANDIIAVIDPKWLRIRGEFAARGGIELTTVVEHPSIDPSKLGFNE